MEEVPAPRLLGGLHVHVADGADVVVLGQLLLRRVVEVVDLGHGRPPLHEGRPALLGLAPDVAVRVNQHHHGSRGCDGKKLDQNIVVQIKEIEILI